MTMTTKSKLAVMLAIATLGLASPAFAQSFDPAIGTGNNLPFGYQQTNNDGMPSAARKLYDMVPSVSAQSASSTANSNSPAATGGGSTGYNQELLIH
jgi:hypothetical protein